MLANDSLGDCGPAAMFHGRMSKIAFDLKKVVSPTDDEVIKFYSAAGGYVPGRPSTDGGVDNPTMLSVAQKEGITLGGVTTLMGPYATVVPDGGSPWQATAQTGIAYLQGALIGVNLPNDWYQSYGPGNVWDVTNSAIVGGHDLWCIGYNATGPVIITWGQPTQCTWAGIAQNATDINCIADQTDEISPTTGCTGDGINLAAWTADVQAITGQPPVLPPSPPSPPNPSGPTHRGIEIAGRLAAHHLLGHFDLVNGVLDAARREIDHYEIKQAVYPPKA
jgi:hypothetical protein